MRGGATLSMACWRAPSAARRLRASHEEGHHLNLQRKVVPFLLLSSSFPCPPPLSLPLPLPSSLPTPSLPLSLPLCLSSLAFQVSNPFQRTWPLDHFSLPLPPRLVADVAQQMRPTPAGAGERAGVTLERDDVAWEQTACTSPHHLRRARQLV